MCRGETRRNCCLLVFCTVWTAAVVSCEGFTTVFPPAFGKMPDRNAQVDSTRLRMKVETAETSQNLAVRPFDLARDRTALVEKVCGNLFWEYVPKTVEGWCKSNVDYPCLLEDEKVGNMVAFGNLQMMSSRAGWMQAIRIAKDVQGRGHGTEITRQLEIQCERLGGSHILSSTSEDNLAMQRIFKKLNWGVFGTCGCWPRMKARSDALGTYQNAREYLSAVGAGHWQESVAEMQGRFEVCREIGTAEGLLKRLGLKQKDQSTTQLFLPSFMRIYSTAQEEFTSALEGGRVWTKDEGEGGAAVVVKFWSPEIRTWSFSVSTAHSDVLRQAILFCAEQTDGEFVVSYQDLGDAWTKNCFGDLETSRWQVFSKQLRDDAVLKP